MGSGFSVTIDKESPCIFVLKLLLSALGGSDSFVRFAVVSGMRASPRRPVLVLWPCDHVRPHGKGDKGRGGTKIGIRHAEMTLQGLGLPGVVTRVLGVGRGRLRGGRGAGVMSEGITLCEPPKFTN